MSLPTHIDIFDMLNFMSIRADLNYIASHMEVKLDEFKKKNPDVDIKEAEKRIQIIHDTSVFIARVERELNVKQRASMDYIMTALAYTKENDVLKSEVDKLTKLLNQP